MFVAWRDLRFARGRFALITVVVVLVSVLVGFLSGLTGGLAWQNVSGVLALPADRIVLAPSAPDAAPTLSDSTLTPEQIDAWTAAAGTDAVTPIGISQVRAQSTDHREGVTLFGGVAASGAPTSDGEVVLSQGAATALQASAGDTVTLVGEDYTVERVAGDDWYSHTPVIHTTLADWQAVSTRMGAADAAATALLVTGSSDSAALDAEAGTVTASPLSALMNLPSFRSEIGSLLLIVGLLFGISALVIGAFFTVWSMQRRGDVAILKALGATNRSVRVDALGQALVVLVIGTGLGLAIVTAAGLALQGRMPFILSPLTTLLPAALMIVVGLAGAMFSLRAVTTADPLTALGSNR
ncbi:ABC transporter permease [Microbacterium sp. ZW T5_45]|uniref:ABC transporter permease n=1 Tax=Microbacterium sp. ZW T5_45 TaxID=3378080 RepID=UPI0038540F6F